MVPFLTRFLYALFCRNSDYLNIFKFIELLKNEQNENYMAMLDAGHGHCPSGQRIKYKKINNKIHMLQQQLENIERSLK